MNLAAILQWLHPQTTPGDRWTLQDDGDGPYIAAWNVPGVPQPTVAELLALAADWQAAGGDAINRRRAAQQLLDALTGPSVVDRAIVAEALGLINANAARLTDLLTWLSTQTALTQRAQLANFVPVQPTMQQARNALAARIAAGEIDS